MAISIDEADRYVRAGGQTVTTDTGQTVQMVKFSDKQVQKINEIRTATNLETHPASLVNREPWINREYVVHVLHQVRRDYIREVGLVPTPDQLFVAWLVGIKPLQKQKFDPARVKETDLQLRLFQALGRTSSVTPPTPLSFHPKEYDEERQRR